MVSVRTVRLRVHIPLVVCDDAVVRCLQILPGYTQILRQLIVPNILAVWI